VSSGALTKRALISAEDLQIAGSGYGVLIAGNAGISRSRVRTRGREFLPMDFFYWQNQAQLRLLLHTVRGCLLSYRPEHQAQRETGSYAYDYLIPVG